ncbi:MAG TPA: integrase [Nitrososphaera sp.]|nr:integrase [Nitrososphaera sp.]
MGLARLALEGELEKYLIGEKRRNMKQVICYATKYAHVLQTGNASELLQLSDSNRRHAMEALACLSKFIGAYDVWKEIMRRYQLKWNREDDSFEVFKSIMDDKHNYSSMISWLRGVCSKLPSAHSNVLKYCTLTGLRSDEACNSLTLLHKDSENYLNRKIMVLEHFRYKEIFIRRTKKAYISIVTEPVLQLAEQSQDTSYKALRSMVKRNGLDMHMKYCRKIFSTHLRTSGIEPEMIDLLQGRIPKSVFGRHYWRPDFEKEKARISECIQKLHTEITP